MKKIKAYFSGGLITSTSPESVTLLNKNFFGKKIRDKVQYSFVEALYLLEKGKLKIFSKDKELTKDEIIKRIKRLDKKIQLRYLVFKDLREKGYILKSALKFGADFRVYKKGKKPKKDHSEWVLFISHELKSISWHEFSAKNRVAHSTKKNLLLAIVDEEGDVSYYEVKWLNMK